MNNNYFYAEITIINNLTNKVNSKNDLLFTLENSTVTVSLPSSLIVETSDIDKDGNKVSYQIYKKFDKEILWDFGDGTILRGSEATHSYKEAGTYYITCTCFDSEGVPYTNNYPKVSQAVKVVDILNTQLRFTNNFLAEVENGLLANIKAGQIFKIAEITSTIDKKINNNIPIKCFTSKSNTPNIFELDSSNPYQHLLLYNTFLDSNNEPLLDILPVYHNIYVTFKYTTNLVLDIYVVANSDNYISDNININDTILKNYICNVHNVEKISEIPSNNYYIGKLGTSEIFYKDDLPADLIETNFILDQSYFPKENILLSKNNLNLVSIGTQVKINKNSLSGNEIIFYSTNGLTTSDKIYDLSIADNIFSFNTAKYLNVSAPFIIRIISNTDDPYFIKDIKIKDIILDSSSVKPANSSIITIFDKFTANNTDIKYTDIGSCFCNLVPMLEDNQAEFTIKLTLEDFNKDIYKSTLLINNLTYIALSSFVNDKSEYYLDPKQNFIDYSTQEILNAYKTHPLFEDMPVLDNYMLAILGSDNFIQMLINKGWSFIDDISNINTCNIKNLISILSSANINTNLYNNENFSKPGVINNLLKIISINHSRLTGVALNESDIFENWDRTAGKNRGEEIKLTDKIYIPKVDNKFVWPKIICYDQYTRQYNLVNAALIENVSPSPIHEDENGFYFSIIEYYSDWGWGLLLGDLEYNVSSILSPEPNNNKILEILTKSNDISKAKENISKYYKFYHYIETDNTYIANSYLKPETISENIKNYDTWYKADGSIDRLLYKTLIESLNLN